MIDLKNELVNRWKRKPFKIGLDDYIAITIALIGILGFIDGPIPFIPGLTEAYYQIRVELIGIGITVLIIGNANEAQNEVVKTREEKYRLILQMGSPAEGFAIEAVRQLRSRGWLFDGSLRYADLKRANLGGADLTRANLSEVILTEADLSLAVLIQSNLSVAHLNSANLNKANLWGADLSGADLAVASLRGAHLSRANLNRASLWGAYFNESDLSEASLRGAYLYGAYLSEANLYCADLRDANLRDADLSEAHLLGANLSEADLGGANLSKARGLTENQIKLVKSLDGATMPDGTKYNGRFNLSGDIDKAKEKYVDANLPSSMADYYGVTLEEYQRGQEWARENLDKLREESNK